MEGKMYRLRDFLREDGHSLIVDSSAGLALGVLPGLEDFEAGARAILPVTDGLVCSPGQLRRLHRRNRSEAGLLVRMDWNNTMRDAEFVLPPTQPHRVPLLTVQDALDLGAVAMVTTFLLGYAEEIEAASLKDTVSLAMEGNAIGMPLVVEVLPSGPRVSIHDKAIELGASYALEGGADAIVIPHPGRKSLETIASFVTVPWFLRATDYESAARALDEALSFGGAGLWFGHNLWNIPSPAAAIEPLWKQLHRPVAV